jgi:hypothetical protein
MRVLALFLLIFARTSWSYSEARCQLVDGFYINSSEPIEDIKFESLVDFFSVGGAKTLSFRMKGQELRFNRTDLIVNQQTKIKFLMLGKGKSQSVLVQLDRSPKQAFKDKIFYGNLVINRSITEWSAYDKEPPVSTEKPLTYNFYCSF